MKKESLPPPYSLLYVCRANKMRSPAAELITRERAGNSNLVVSSAGLMRPDLPSTAPEMIHALEDRGYAPQLRTTNKLNTDGINKADLVLCFEDSQREQILQNYPPDDFTYRLDTIHGFSGVKKEVRDPDSLIKKRILYELICNLPLPIRMRFYQLMGGFVDNRDYGGVVNLCGNTVRQIENLVDLALKRLREEGKIV